MPWRKPLLSMCLAVLAAAAPCQADPVHEPAEAGIQEGGKDWGRYPFGVSLETDKLHTSGATSGTSTQVSLGNRADGTLGFAATQGHVTGPDRQSAPAESVGSTGTVWFALSITPLPGGLILPAYPVKVRAAGEAHVEASGLAGGYAEAVVSFTDLYLSAKSPAGTGQSESFDHVATQWLAPGLHRGWVQAGGWGMALCLKVDAHDPDDACVKGSASYSAVADPGFALDQAAWDARYPEQPVVLANLYRIDVNPNVPAGPQALVPIGVVPEPASAVLWLGGLLALAAAKRWRPSPSDRIATRR